MMNPLKLINQVLSGFITERNCKTMVIYLEPKPNRRHRNNHITRTCYKDKQQKINEKELITLLKQFKPKEPTKKPVFLKIDYYLSQTKTELKQKLKSKQRELGILKHIKKPDADNIEKLLLDCMTKTGFWKDDAQAFSIWHTKNYDDGNGARIEIVLMEVE